MSDTRAVKERTAEDTATSEAPVAWEKEADDGAPVIGWEVPDADRFQLLVVQADEEDASIVGEAALAEELPYAPMPEEWGAQYEVRALRGENLLAASTVGTGDPRKKADIRAYARKLEQDKQGWEAISPKKKDETKRDKSVVTREGKWVKTVTPVEMTKTPTGLVTFSAASNNTLWPGSFVQGAKALDGKLVTLGVSHKLREKIKLSISGLTTNPPVDDAEPTHTGTLTAVKEAVKDAPDAARNFRLAQVTGQTEDQICLELGVSAKYLRFSASLNFKASVEKYSNTLVAYLQETCFTVMPSADDINDLFNEQFTEAELEKLKTAKVIGPKNPPLYVSAVHYGRILYFAVSAKKTVAEIQAAVEASYGGFANANLKAKYQKLLSESKVTALGVGCPGNIGSLLAGDKGLKEFLDQQKTTPKLYGIVGYELKTFTDEVAVQAETAKYPETVWSEDTLRVKVNEINQGSLTASGTWQMDGEKGTFNSKSLSPAPTAAFPYDSFASKYLLKAECMAQLSNGRKFTRAESYLTHREKYEGTLNWDLYNGNSFVQKLTMNVKVEPS